MNYDVLLEYPILKVLLGVIFVILGFRIMMKNKFFKYDSNDMLFATKIKIFLSGLLFFLLGLVVFGNGVFNLIEAL
jgi:hypothetical protein